GESVIITSSAGDRIEVKAYGTQIVGNRGSGKPFTIAQDAETISAFIQGGDGDETATLNAEYLKITLPGGNPKFLITPTGGTNGAPVMPDVEAQVTVVGSDQPSDSFDYDWTATVGLPLGTALHQIVAQADEDFPYTVFQSDTVEYTSSDWNGEIRG